MAQIKSPNYPSLGLADAIDAIGKIEQLYRSTAVSREDAAKLIGYSSLSGPATKSLAALSSYGLAERAGKGMLRATPLSRDILHPKSDHDRVEATIKAGLTPSLFRELRDHFENIPVPPEQGVISYLNRAGFHPTAVPKAAKAFINTAELLESLDKQSHESPEPKIQDLSSQQSGSSDGVAVGNYVLWESLGSQKFATPRRVRWVSEDGSLIAVDGSEEAIPIDEVTVKTHQDRVAPPQSPPPLPVTVETPPLETQPPTAPKGGHLVPGSTGELRTAVFPVSDGDVTFVFPADITLEGLEELEDYLKVFLKREKRDAQRGS